MTQHDETGRPPAGGPATAPAGDDAGDQRLPSPYLEPGQSIPQAYLAPPQPGQPRYGTGPGGRTTLGPGGDGLAGRQQSGGTMRGGARPQSRRDPAIAAPWERLIATILDWAIIFTLSVLAFLSPLLRMWHEVQAITTQFGGNLNSPDAQAAITSFARNPSNQQAALYWFLAMFGIALAYYWIQHALFGATIGKRALGTRVVTAADSGRIGVGAAGIRALAFLIGPAVFLLLPSPYSVIGGIAWLADTALPLLDQRAQCLHDKVAGTIVIRQRWLARQARAEGRPW